MFRGRGPLLRKSLSAGGFDKESRVGGGRLRKYGTMLHKRFQVFRRQLRRCCRVFPLSLSPFFLRWISPWNLAFSHGSAVHRRRLWPFLLNFIILAGFREKVSRREKGGRKKFPGERGDDDESAQQLHMCAYAFFGGGIVAFLSDGPRLLLLGPEFVIESARARSINVIMCGGRPQIRSSHTRKKENFKEEFLLLTS